MDELDEMTFDGDKDKRPNEDEVGLESSLSKRKVYTDGTVSKASEKRIFRDLLSRLIDQIEEPAPGFA
jgi:hypothetical protein